MNLFRFLSTLALLLATIIAPKAAMLPLFSNDSEEHWYLLTYNTSLKFVQDNGDAQTLTAADRAADSNAQLWKLVGNKDAFTLVSKEGRCVNRADMFKAYDDPAKAHTFRLLESNFDKCWMINLPGDDYGCMNNYGSGIGGWLADANDPNNAIRFATPDEVLTDPDDLPGAPTFSTEADEHWYVISYATGGRVFTDNGNGQAMTHITAIAGNEAQMWKLVGNPDSFQLISKLGGYVYKDGPFRTSTDSSKAISLKLEKAGNPTFSDCLQINYTGDGWGIMNQYGNGTIDGYYNDPTDQNNAIRFIDPESITTRPDMSGISEFDVEGIGAFTPAHRSTLWYDMPVTAMNVQNPWMEYALPIGNGEFGAMVYGGIHCDQLQFNDKSLWTGSSKARGSYQNFGDVFIEDISGTFDAAPVKDYVRYLDMSEAIAGASYSDGTTTYTREYLSSYPDKVVAVRLSASDPGKLSLRIRLLNNVKIGLVGPRYSDGEAYFQDKLDLVSFKAALKVVPEGGTMTTNTDNIEIAGANEVVIILAGGTNFDQRAADYITDAEAMKSAIADRVAAASAKGWDAIKADHIADFQSFFGRVDLDLAAASNDMATDKLIKGYRQLSAESPQARLLEELYFNYGRYLLISSSRGMDTPANLQGIWNNSDSPAWQSDIHSNINVQMNYWLAENCNLSELHLPFLNYVYSMALEHPQWPEYATRSGQSKGWTCFTQNNIFGHSDYAENYVIANAWYTSHLWKHYLYTQDVDFLREKAFPVMKSCAEFWLERLVEAADGSLVAPKEWSPEHGPAAEDGTAHAQQIVADLFASTLQAADILGLEAANTAFTAELLDKFVRLDKGLDVETYTGAWGSTLNGITKGTEILREWKYSPYSAGQNGHRHQSHLMALYPFNQITPESEYFVPAVNSLRLRGDESTGWSLAWRVNLWARALEGDKAHDIIRNALRHSTSYAIQERAGGVYYNLFDSHAPFQIDGNFGFSAGVAEMLLQSYNDEILLLPALPASWTDGHADGLRAVGNFEVNQTWENGCLTSAVVTSHSGLPCTLKYAGIGEATITDADGNPAEIIAVTPDKITFTTGPGISYIVTTDGLGSVGSVADDTEIAVTLRDKVLNVNRSDATITVYDLPGRCLATSTGATLDLSQLGANVVIVKVSTPTATATYKFVL